MTKTAKQMTIRAMNRAEFSLAIEWATQEGWNPGLYDAEVFWAADQGGYLIGLIDGKPVAVILAVRYGEHFGFMEFYIVKPEFRGKGYGLAIWQAALDYLQGRTIGLDGVVAQQENYKRSGFTLAHRNIRYEGVSQPAKSDWTTSPVRVVPLQKFPTNSLLTYDKNFFPEPRTEFLQVWIDQPGTTVLGTIDGTRLTGYGVIRPCRYGFKIGPLFADTTEIAEALLIALKQYIPAGATYYLDVPACNKAALVLVERHGMKMGLETVRMYLGSYSDHSLDRTYAITRFELG